MNSQHHFQLIADSLHWLCKNQQDQPSLEALAAHVGFSPHYMQRLFQEWAGVSPKQFVKYLTKTQALERLKQGETVLEAAASSGLSGPGRLHDLLITTQAMTPGEAKRQGQGVEVDFGFGHTPFGEALLGWTDKGICFLGFCHDDSREHLWSNFNQQWPDAILTENNRQAKSQLADIFSGSEHKELKIWLRGSPFQLRIWEALLKLPAGVHCTYGQLASLTGNAGASRATGTAIGRNPVAWLIPCHRVINSLGTLGGYRWGVDTKKAMIGYEAAKTGV
jgi:AraC family transcriptional regulator of adaptative response/methylated-DNA-[protein]-cysteine methyltransferase